MNDFHIGLIGIVAAICTTCSLLPQIIKILRTKRTHDISMAMYLLLTFGIVCWLVYGFMIEEFPIILANGLTVVLCFVVIIAKIKYDRR